MARLIRSALLAALALLVACTPETTDAPPILLDEADANPALTEPVIEDASLFGLLPDGAERMHVVEDISALGNLVTLRFRPGREDFDSIRATTTSGSLTRADITWRLSSNAGSALVTLKVFQTIPDAKGKLKLAQPTYAVWVQSGEPQTFTIPGFIDPTGTDDVCPADGSLLQKWLNGLPNGAVITTTPNARYRCDYGIALVDKWNLSFTGPATLFTDYSAGQTTDSARRGFRLLSFLRGGNITFEDWTFRGPRPVGSTSYIAIWETQHGMELNATNGVTLRRVKVENVWGDFVNLSFSNTKWGDGLFVSEPTRHVEITESTFSNSGRQGIAMTGLYDARIHDNTFAGVQRSLWDFEPGGTDEWVQGVEIYQNDIVGPVRNNVVAGHGSGRWMQDLTIRDNDFGEKPFRMSFGGNIERRGLRILRNVARVELGSTVPSIAISGIDDVEVIDNVMPQQARRRNTLGILLQNQTGYRVEGNSMPNADEECRWVEDKNNPDSRVEDCSQP